LARQTLEVGLNPLDCINYGLNNGIQQVGQLFADGECYLPELVQSADAMKAGLMVLEPAMIKGKCREIVGTVVLGTVQGDLHEIGKNLVGTMLTANGFNVIDLGVNVPVTEFIKSINEHNATIAGVLESISSTNKMALFCGHLFSLSKGNLKSSRVCRLLFIIECICSLENALTKFINCGLR